MQLLTALLVKRGRACSICVSGVYVTTCLRFLGRPDRPARSSVPRPDPAAQTADRERSVGQHGDCGQHHPAPRSLHTGSSKLRPPAVGGRSPGGITLHRVTQICRMKVPSNRGCVFQVDVRTIHGSTPLCNACASGSLECAKLLLEYGAKVNPSLTALTASPLHEACIQGKPSKAAARHIQPQ